MPARPPQQLVDFMVSRAASCGPHSPASPLLSLRWKPQNTVFSSFSTRASCRTTKLIAIALSDAFAWRCPVVYMSAGLWRQELASAGNDPVYVKSRCFETFPFPTGETGSRRCCARITRLAEH